jgi:hypothetical protein
MESSLNQSENSENETKTTNNDAINSLKPSMVVCKQTAIERDRVN